jgi:oligoribonuclease NrnB/cAMP/cGMP phosphodiesterase (DHH superfamily)
MRRIITHNDFDGLVSAAICSFALKINFIVFTGPRTVSEARISITDEDVVCDLPYPLECDLWFDHHEANLEELRFRKIDPASLKGRFDGKDSCARVVYEYFAEKVDFPEHFENIVAEADVIDAFNYASIEEWRTPTPGKIIDGTIKYKGEPPELKWKYLRNLVYQLKLFPIEKVAQMPSVKKRYAAFMQEEEGIIEQIKKDVVFLPIDQEKKLVVIDSTKHNRQPYLLKHLAYLEYPEAEAVIEVKNLFRNNTKTNDLTLSMSLSLNLANGNHSKDVGAIMRELNIGSGHPGAAAGVVVCSSKENMLKEKERILEQIYKIFIEQ